MLDYYEKYMNMALFLSAKAEAGGDIPVGALVLHNNEVIARGYNMVEQNNQPTAHAELIALEAAAKHLGTNNLSECTLVTTLEPCGMCSGAIAHYRVGLVVFGAYDPQYGCLFSKVDLPKLMGKPVRVIGGVLEEQCKAMLDACFIKMRK